LEDIFLTRWLLTSATYKSPLLAKSIPSSKCIALTTVDDDACKIFSENVHMTPESTEEQIWEWVDDIPIITPLLHLDNYKFSLYKEKRLQTMFLLNPIALYSRILLRRCREKNFIFGAKQTPKIFDRSLPPKNISSSSSIIIIIIIQHINSWQKNFNL
jgi:hypothetical protein